MSAKKAIETGKLLCIEKYINDKYYVYFPFKIVTDYSFKIINNKIDFKKCGGHKILDEVFDLNCINGIVISGYTSIIIDLNKCFSIEDVDNAISKLLFSMFEEKEG